MSRLTIAVAVLATLLACSFSVTSCRATGSARTTAPAADDGLGSAAHEQEVMRSSFCASCHPDIYAEHAMNTHGRAFTDAEVRLATGNFEHGDCIRCHTPRPVFETGIGLNPQRRFHNLEEGNTCMTCHWQQGTDYSRFQGGAECKTAFDDRVGTVEACASCHRNHGTPYQWELAEHGKQEGNTCMSCHMELIERPVAVGGPVRRVRSHVFPGARSESQVRRAYEYEAKIVGNEVEVRVTNVGAGHNFPTELKQRSLESLIVVRDAAGNEVSRSRMVFRDPYKRPYGLHLPVNTQIPSGESRTHKVPIKVADGTVDCELHFKHYFPIEDNHPELARRLELRKIPFAGVTPSDKPVIGEPEVKVVTPAGVSARDASVAELVDFARPKIAKTQIDVPAGSDEAAIRKLIDLFMFPVPEGNRAAQKRLAEIGLPAVPFLIEALGSWDNKTFNQSKHTLEKIGAPAVPAIRAALRSEQLYVRLHARELLERMPVPADKPALIEEVRAGLRAGNALDRATTCSLLANLGATAAADDLRALLVDRDPDVVVAAAKALADLNDRVSAAAIAGAMERATWDETRMALASALCALGDVRGVPVLMRNLNHRDDLLRETCFELLFDAIGVHRGYEPHGMYEERLAAIARLEAWWAREGGSDRLRRVYKPAPIVHENAFKLVMTLGEEAGIEPKVELDAVAIEKLVTMGQDALPALRLGLKFPSGYAAKRAAVMTVLGRIGDKWAAPFLCGALNDASVIVAAYAAQALARCGDADCLPALVRYQSRVLSMQAAGQIPPIAQADDLIAAAAAARLALGDVSAKTDLANLLLSDQLSARSTAIAALTAKFGDNKGYEASADPEARRTAAVRWLE